MHSTRTPAKPAPVNANVRAPRSNNTHAMPPAEPDIVSFFGFGDEAIAAIIVFVLGVIFTIIWTNFQREKHRLSYEISHREIVVDAPIDVEGKIRLFYGEEEVSFLRSYNLNLRNTGNKSVQDQTVRLDFPGETRLLVEPELQHEPLVGPVDLVSKSDFPLAITYKIGQMPKGSAISFRFLTCNNADPSLKVSGRNEQNPDTEFLAKGASRQSTSRERFLELVLLVFAYHLVNLIPSAFLFYPLKAGILLGLVLVAMPRALRLAGDVHDRFLAQDSTTHPVNINAGNSANVTYVDMASQVSISKDEP